VHVSRIEMTGFKSFADRTVVTLEPGVAAVVGPNGCGKTNICDAIRWVLGEENVRLLRGARIEDIIFAGTEVRKPIGMAEVSLTVSDVRDVLPVDYNEVTVTRRVFRSGESQFFINKVPSRLKDIVDLFLGTGMGRRAYSIMEREMIDWILEDNDGQRRKIIEEAAGISKYKVRRKETMNKLELTRRDLERVEDLIAEVERRVKSLSRQAAKARRYERLADRIKELETYSSVKEFHAMGERRRHVEKELNDITTRLAELSKRISVDEAAIETMKLEVVEVEKQINEQGRNVASTADEIQESENKKIVILERKRAIDDRVHEVSELKEQKSALIDEKERLLEAKREEIRGNSESLEALGRSKNELTVEYGEKDADLRSRRERSLLSARKQVENIQATIDAASAAGGMRSKRTHIAESLERSESKFQDISSRVKGLDAEIDEIRAGFERLGSESSDRTAGLEELSSTIEEITSRLESIREERARLGEEVARATSRYDVFRELVERYEGYEHGVKALMQEGRSEGVHGVVGDVVRCTDLRYEPAVVAALSDAIQYVIVEGRQLAADSVRMLKEGKKGAATLVMLESIPSAHAEPPHEAPGEVVGRIMDFIECESKYRDLLDYLLRDVYVVEDLDQAFALAGSENGHLSYVTPEGDAVFRGSVVRSGGDGEGAGAFIGRREKVDGLADEAQALRRLASEQEKAYEELKASLADLTGNRDARQSDLVRIGREMAEQEKMLESRIAERDSLGKVLGDLEGEIAGLRDSLGALDREIAEAGREYETQGLEQGGLFEGAEDHATLEEQVTDLRRRLEDTSHEILRLQSNGGFLEDTVRRISREIEELRAEIAGLDATEADLGRHREELTADEGRLRTEVEKLLAVLGGYEDKRKEAIDRKNGFEAEIEEKRKAIRTASHEKEEVLSGKQDLQAEANVLEVKSDNLRQRMIEEYDLDIAKVDLEELAPSENCEEELAKLRGHLRSLGPVNLVALDEYDVEKQRYDFLRTQRDDLVKARESLDEAILQINRRARSEFADTFEKVRKDFQRNFATLFQGGSADMVLRYEHDPLESPVDILAQPSGKKLEHIALLSGGERALTAIAFLFAVYYTKPSPFCLLDEVDAPLDDANVNRFIDLIKDFSKRTQFLMVTHNKKTMEAASCLYGVTMEEPGVSRMVSVRLERTRDEEPETVPVG
jgi:chromosome segregation protein